ncbi:MAG: hypothetical protein ACRCUP_03290, partial [Mycoplasmatales bacterium]
MPRKLLSILLLTIIASQAISIPDVTFLAQTAINEVNQSEEEKQTETTPTEEVAADASQTETPAVEQEPTEKVKENSPPSEKTSRTTTGTANYPNYGVNGNHISTIDPAKIDDQNETVSLIENLGFESPIVTTGTMEFISENNPKIKWKTTDNSTDFGVGPIEVWRNTYHGMNSVEGDQFAEVNARRNASIYQDIYLPNGFKQGQTLSWSFYHHNTFSGVESLKFQAGVPGSDNNQNEIETVVSGNKYVSNELSVTPSENWKLQSGTFTVPTDVTNTLRIAFSAVKSAAGGDSGNLIDNIRFTISSPPAFSSTVTTSDSGSNQIGQRDNTTVTTLLTRQTDSSDVTSWTSNGVDIVQSSGSKVPTSATVTYNDGTSESLTVGSVSGSNFTLTGMTKTNFRTASISWDGGLAGNVAVGSNYQVFANYRYSADSNLDVDPVKNIMIQAESFTKAINLLPLADRGKIDSKVKAWDLTPGSAGQVNANLITIADNKLDDSNVTLKIGEVEPVVISATVGGRVATKTVNATIQADSRSIALTSGVYAEYNVNETITQADLIADLGTELTLTNTDGSTSELDSSKITINGFSNISSTTVGGYVVELVGNEATMTSNSVKATVVIKDSNSAITPIDPANPTKPRVMISANNFDVAKKKLTSGFTGEEAKSNTYADVKAWDLTPTGVVGSIPTGTLSAETVTTNNPLFQTNNTLVAGNKQATEFRVKKTVSGVDYTASKTVQATVTDGRTLEHTGVQTLVYDKGTAQTKAKLLTDIASVVKTREDQTLVD